MHWKHKARIQNTVSLLPSGVSYAAYYWLQRRFGGLRRINPVTKLAAGIETWKLIQKHGGTPAGKVFFEIGTGRIPLVPLAYWLMGAGKTVTIDLNPYVKEELVREALSYIAINEAEIAELFGPLLDANRFNALLNFCNGPVSTLSDFLALTDIEYISPGDAADTGLPDNCIDFHTSYNVFEHIPRAIFANILTEGNRLIRDDGMFVHRVDYSDHFSHSDKNISAINFLQYSDHEWNRYADNRYMYMNRLRHDDFINLFEQAGHCLIESQTDIDERSQVLLRADSIKLDERFEVKTRYILSVTSAWIITRKGT